MGRYAFLSLALAAIVLGGCTGPVIMGSDAAAVYLTKPATPPPADTGSQIAGHESWCYSTMGDPDCYAQAQDVPPSRLINVDPQSRYPLNARAYRRMIASEKVATTTPFSGASSAPVVLSISPTAPVEQMDESADGGAPPSEPASPPASKMP